MKKLSVITVTYNCASLIQKTLENVLMQDESIVEYIVIDGGSADGTVDIINKYKDRFACTISEPDDGIYDAMNKGVSFATGDWILFLNAGDVFHEKLQLASFKFEWPINTEFVVFPFVIEGDFQPKLPDLTVRFGMPTSHQAMFISSKIAKQFKLNSNYKVAADYEFFLKRKLQNNDCVQVENIVLARVLPGGYSAENFNTMRKEYQKIIFDHLGMSKALVYYFWSRPFVFKVIKTIMPVSLFNRLKKQFRVI
jgi:glycosyltransferase involved in cell wall biosynthesis